MSIIISASAGGLDCVAIIRPDISGIHSIIAAGSRDHRVYLWRKRSAPQQGAASSRTIRGYITAELKDHRVSNYNTI